MTFAQSLRNAKLLKGTILTTSSAEIAEAVSYAGLDWVFIDMEHAPLAISEAQNLVRAIGNRLATIIRIPDHSPTWIKQALDTGCSGIIVPQVNTAAEVNAILQSAHYANGGRRSVGITRAHAYGLNFQEYIKSSNDNVAVIAQIESITAVKNIDDILSVPGLNAIFIGPYDLSASMNKIGQLQDREVLEAIDKVFTIAQKKNVPIGIFAADMDDAKTALKKGANFIAVGIDVGLLISAIKKIAALEAT